MTSRAIGPALRAVVSKRASAPCSAIACNNIQLASRAQRDFSSIVSTLRRNEAAGLLQKPDFAASTRPYTTEGSAPPSEEPLKPVRTTSAASLSKTPLYDLHVEQKAKLVPFAGYEMPLTYAWGGQLNEHAQVRQAAGLFDVSHMVQSVINGDGATRFLEYLLPASVESLTFREESAFKDTQGVEGPFLSSLSVMLNENGGIIDDLMLTRQGDEQYYVVTNAGRRDEDLKHMQQALQDFNARNNTNVQMDVLDNQGLLALQGPMAQSALQGLVLEGVDLSKLYFGQSIFADLKLPYETVKVHIARGGYTGEDGFEISIPTAQSIPVARALLDGKEAVQLVGLAARDSLRLEAGMCLYGHDLSEDVNVFQASLAWVVGEDRRAASRASFIGAQPTVDALTAKRSATKRVGLVIEPGLTAREGTALFEAGAGADADALPIGRITSGIPSPTLKQNIAMAYVNWGKHKIGTELEVRLRGKHRKAHVAKMPFVKPNYYRAPK